MYAIMDDAIESGIESLPDPVVMEQVLGSRPGYVWNGMKYT